jgi:four helix bundle protein
MRNDGSRTLLVNLNDERQTMNNENLKKRTKKFALDVIKFFEALPKNETCRILGRQLLRSRTSVGANYRAACRAKSTADFISKMRTVEEEADESSYWIELLIEDDKVAEAKAGPLMKEANELVAITISSINTARKSGGRP